MHEVKEITIVIDAFRAAATASYVLAQSPKHYFLATKSDVGARLHHSFSNLVMNKSSNLGGGKRLLVCFI